MLRLTLSHRSCDVDTVLPERNKDVMFKSLSDGAVIFSPTDEVYFGLNAVGVDVWELLPPVMRTLDDLCAEIARRYPDADLPTIRTDVVELLDKLEEYGLVIPPNADGASDPSEASAARQPK